MRHNQYQMQIRSWGKVLVYDLWAWLYWPVAFLEALMISEGGLIWRQGSRLAIFMAIIDDKGAIQC